MSENDRKKSWITEALVIAAAPLMGYSFAFAFELGYAEYFEIPPELISINLFQIIIFILGTYSICLVLFFFIEMLSFLIPSKYQILRSKLLDIVPLIMFLVGYFLAGGWLRALPFIFLLVIISFSSFILPLISQRNVKGYNAKLEAAEAKDWGMLENNKTFSISLINLFGYKNIIMITNIFLALSLVKMSGEVYASRRVMFPILKGNSEKVILSIYGDNLVCSSFDRQKKEVASTFSVYKLASNDAQNMSQEIIGPIKIVDAGQ